MRRTKQLDLGLQKGGTNGGPSLWGVLNLGDVEQRKNESVGTGQLQKGRGGTVGLGPTWFAEQTTKTLWGSSRELGGKFPEVKRGEKRA